MYKTVNAPRRWYYRVLTNLRNMRGEDSLIEPCLWTFRDENGVIHALCLVFVDDFMRACSDSPCGKLSLIAATTWGTWESRVFTQCGARITQAYDKHTRTWADLGSVSQNTRKKIRSSPCHHIDAETENPESLHMSCLNFEPRMVSCSSWVCNVCHSCRHNHHNHSAYEVGQNATQSPRSSSSCCGLRTQILDGPLDQTALRKGDSWSSSQTPSYCKQRIKHVSDILALESSETCVV